MQHPTSVLTAERELVALWEKSVGSSESKGDDRLGLEGGGLWSLVIDLKV